MASQNQDLLAWFRKRGRTWEFTCSGDWDLAHNVAECIRDLYGSRVRCYCNLMPC